MTREEIIDELCRLRSDIVNVGGYVKRTDAQKNRFAHALSEEIQRLQTEHCEDCISRELVLRELDKYLCGVPFDEKGIDEVIKDLPSVQPEIIRCCQCKYAEVADSEDSEDGYTCQFHRGSIWFSGSYCSWAERRQNG